MRRFYPFIFSAGLLLPSCSIPDQIDSLTREQRTLKTQNTASQGELDSIRASLADTRANVDQLRRDVRALQEKVEEVRYQFDRRIGQVGQSSRDGDLRVKDLEARVAKLSDELKAQASQLKARDDEMRKRDDEMRKMREAMQSMAADTASVRAANETRERAAAEAASAKRDYDDAMRIVERKDYRAAILRLKEFLNKYPDHALAEDAQYWLGESFYNVKEYDQAILEFDGVRRRFPKGDKVPGALLKQGLAFAELNDRLDARLILQELVERFPDSEEAARAKQRLKSLDSPGARSEPPAGRDAPGSRTPPPARR